MSRISTRRLVYQSLIAALIALCTAFIKLPVSITNGYVHLGDGAISSPPRCSAPPDAPRPRSARRWPTRCSAITFTSFRPSSSRARWA